MVQAYKYFGVHINNKWDLSNNTCELYEMCKYVNIQSSAINGLQKDIDFDM